MATNVNFINRQLETLKARGRGVLVALRWYDKGRRPVHMSGVNKGPIGHQGRIARDPRVPGGEPVFKGTRVTLRTVLASLAEGDPVEEILADFPSLTPEDVRAAIAFAAASAEEDLPLPAVPQIG